ncbi:hypothetical protein [Mythimna sequax nucleopolyhedrovirus]|nr:hypothetical protein [Mythimna sequax nucleopolyhedrovirus]
MNYTVAPFEPQPPCTWSAYVDMFNEWRQCLSFNSRLLDDLYSEYLFVKFQSYRDKVHYSGISYWHFDQYFMTLKEFKQWCYYDYFLETGKSKTYTYEQYVSANPNITMFTVQKHAEFAWDYNQLHCFLGENDAQVKERLRKSRFWKRRYAEWSECLRDGSTLMDLCYNKYMDIIYFIENDYIFRQILDSNFFKVFCENPNVTWDFLKNRVTYDSGIPLKKRIITLVNPNVRWCDILQFCHTNDLLLQSDFWADYEATIVRSNYTIKKGNEFTHVYANYPYLLDYKKFRKHVTCDIISAIVQKPDVPEEVVLSLHRQFIIQFHCVGDEFDLCDHKCTLRKKNNIKPIFLNVNLRNKYKMSNLNAYSCENSKTVLKERKKQYYTSCPLDRTYFKYRIGYSKNINLRLNDIDDKELLHLDIMLFQNPMPLEKQNFLIDILTPAAVKIQRWYLKHFYRPEGRYVNTVIRNRFNASIYIYVN